MSQPEPEKKKGGWAAIAAGFSLLIAKGGMACGHLLAGAKPAVIAEEAARGLSHAPVVEDAARGAAGAVSHMSGAAEVAEKGGRGLVETAEQASRRKELFQQDLNRIARSGQAVLRSQARGYGRANERRDEERR